jgi:multisubunit Na+/H+ antiporter MnhC subunit
MTNLLLIAIVVLLATNGFTLYRCINLLHENRLLKVWTRYGSYDPALTNPEHHLAGDTHE